MTIHSWKDNDGRDWPLEFGFGTVKRVKRLTSIDLLQQEDTARYTRDLSLLVDVMYAAWQPRAEELKVTDEQFGELVFAHFEDATRAYVEALADFFHRLGRSTMATMLTTAMRLQEEQKKAIEEKLNPTTIESLLRQQNQNELTKLDQALQEILGGGSTSSPESPT